MNIDPHALYQRRPWDAANAQIIVAKWARYRNLQLIISSDNYIIVIDADCNIAFPKVKISTLIRSISFTHKIRLGLYAIGTKFSMN